MNTSIDAVELDSRFIWLTAFFRSYHCFYAIHPLSTKLDEPYLDLAPFGHLNNVLLYDTIISWCKIFGVDNEDCHWKRVVKDKDKFRGFLFESINITQEQFSEYQRGILEFRNKWVVHYDPQFNHDVVPSLDLAYQSAIALHSYLQTTLHEGIEYAGPASMDEFGKRVADLFRARLKIERNN